MRASIARIVEQFQQSWSRELEDEAIDQAMREAGHKWRNRDLPPVVTVRMFLLQILFGNVACNHVPHLARKDVTGSAYCEARGRLPLVALQTLLTRCTTKMVECARDSGLWLGHRLFFMDGSSFSMPEPGRATITTPQPAAPAQPAPAAPEKDKPEGSGDDASARFSLLELD